MTLRRPPPGFPEGVTFKLIVGVRRALWGLGGDVRAPNRDRTDLLTSLLGRWGKAGGRGDEVGNGGGSFCKGNKTGQRSAWGRTATRPSKSHKPPFPEGTAPDRRGDSGRQEQAELSGFRIWEQARMLGWRSPPGVLC